MLHKKQLTILIGAIALTLIFILAQFTNIQVRGFFNIQNIKLIITSLGALGYVAFCAIFVLSSLFMIPTTVMVLSAGVIFPPVTALILNVISLNLVALFVFTLSRAFFRQPITRYLKSKYKNFDTLYTKMASYNILDLIVIHFIPVLPFHPLNMMLGLTPVSTRDFIFTTFIGTLPLLILFTFFGERIAKKGLPYIIGFGIVLLGITIAARFVKTKP
jgi:uncharacterized membrane protein YdjX (TVP38/TMEM64 family)